MTELEPPWWTPRKTVARRSLNREAIVAAARTVLRDEGIDALSMRRVASELGTGPASLYAHVAHKDELLELLLDDVSGEVPLPEPDPARWREQVTQLWTDTRNAVMANGDIARVALGRVPLGPNAMRLSETTLTLLRLGGVPEQAAAWAVDVIGMYVAANAIEGSIDAREERAGRDPVQYYAQVHKYFTELPPDRFPTTTALASKLATGDGEDRFRFGLDLLVGGLAAMTDGP
ncbi:TetR/AcrR family transcriptional regulator [Pseudonocardia endophytica]|uniref:TetR family transcriptional regulator n=1 Tax=Pseudonocardia endophytica TaxID=401976 RepID=A0A4R1HNS6_PSEEN|nr:TetR/AcrR family transcriptional regulator [Pseudonocardia endophytica]TCK21349.1 TetR family transcriptional regulator [Pseudonocardia endophytica]